MMSVASNGGSPDGGWQITPESGSVHDLHNLKDPATSLRTVRIMSPTLPTIALGSSQPESVVDLARASANGLGVARRRSGGGAVLIIPGEHLWVEFLVPRGDRLWDDDIVKAADWVGAAWADTLHSAGVDDLSVHHGRLIKTQWSHMVCFAGVGPGEVLTNHRKVMGLSQRRNREWTRIQTIVHLIWRPELLVDSLAMESTQRRECLAALADGVASAEFDCSALTQALLTKLPD